MDDRIVDSDSLDWEAHDHGDRAFRGRRFTRASAASELGCSLYEIEPGKRGWPAHYHEGNEEAMFVLDGSATLWLGGDREERDLEAGDFAVFPRGEDGQHELEAGPDGLRYLAMSTMYDPDITVYPDNDAVGVFAGSPPGGDESERRLSKYLDADAEVPYWDGGDGGSQREE
ncbi:MULTISPECIES: cupin domain-containing protein [Halomicrobium]|uniref:Cupin 2 conserved barrel domain protein n=2 Tax=Halomicrobium mukohataei TaxID=57705 RepID=C7NWU6_HALMD|nr:MULTISPECIES: cupin domain-containing protein [Halomicrobium]ACV48306.1 Cupin 2 conserved barrel domain protein [Halomicrobium mukohataei DSM 12286]QCD66723.1 cupin domain-containing protein [Halomicrobium mukohataei]QFR21529.1 cupin domain-containing protein [Halomicrobium sp. ZPS1]